MIDNNSKKRRASSPCRKTAGKTRAGGSKKHNAGGAPTPARPQAAAEGSGAGAVGAFTNICITTQPPPKTPNPASAMTKKADLGYNTHKIERAYAYDVIAAEGEQAPGWYSRRTICGSQSMQNSILGLKNGRLVPLMIYACRSRKCSRCASKMAATEANILATACLNFRTANPGSQLYMAVFHHRTPGHGWDAKSSGKMEEHYNAAHRWEQLRLAELTPHLYLLKKLGLMVWSRANEATAKHPKGKVLGRFNAHCNFIFGLAVGADEDMIKKRLIELNTSALRRSFQILKKEYPDFCAQLDPTEGFWDPSLFFFQRIPHKDIEATAGYITKGVGGLSASLELTAGTLKRGRVPGSYGCVQLIRVMGNVDKKYAHWESDWARDAHRCWIGAEAKHRQRAYGHSKMLNAATGTRQNWVKVYAGVEMDDEEQDEVVPTHRRRVLLSADEVSFIETREATTALENNEEVFGHKRESSAALAIEIEIERDKRRKSYADRLVARGHLYSPFVLEVAFGGSKDRRDEYIERRWRRFNPKERPAVKPFLLERDFKKYYDGLTRARLVRGQAVRSVLIDDKPNQRRWMPPEAPDRAWWEPILSLPPSDVR